VNGGGLLLAGAALVFLAAPSRVTAAPRILYPPDAAVVSGEGAVTVIAEDDAPGARAHMEVRIDGRANAPPAVLARRSDGRAVLHSRVPLRPGLNTLEIALGASGPPPRTVTLRVFFFSPLLSGQEAPPQFRRQPFHRLASAGACEGCHELEPRPGDAGPPSPEQSTCHSCHRSLTARKEVHGPAAAWVCTRCHDPSSPDAPHATPVPVMPLCFSCHVEQKDRFYGERFQHGPTATGHCTICHSPHGTDEPFFLKKAAFDLCITCHSEKASGRHVISWGPSGQGHPTRGRPDPLRPGRELSCASCHNPHAAPGPRLWNFGATIWLELCRNCHRSLM
jgi:predicted CXXCH cytochrome family protein